MTEGSRIFERRGSRGWVIIAGESPAVRGSEASALETIKGFVGPEGAVVVIAPGGDIPSSSQPLLNEITARLVGNSKIIDPLAMDQTLIQTNCQQAKLVLAMGGNRQDWNAIFAEERMPADPDLVINEHSVFIAIGSLVSILGEWVYDPESDQVYDGIGWFPKAIFLPGLEAPGSKKGVRGKIETQMRSYAVSIAPDTIIGFGPQRKFEIWSDVAPEILLGQGWV